ncbi:MAG: IS110 family transposase [Alphaproteobacteria bacterium 41-28]|jgi:transposase|nr:MAG: IS110 family transposase [Alphaproteobacteria bacterium 41-28]
MNITILGIDIAKNVFQLHGANSHGKKLFSKRVGRATLLRTVQQIQPCLIGMEACGSSHYWARKFTELGHTVKLIGPQFVKPYVKTNKNDANDAEAICEAVSRASMRFVPIKNVQQQEIQLVHKVRGKLIKDKIALGNQIRGLLLEYGVAIPQGDAHLRKALASLSPLSEGSDLTNYAKIIFDDLYIEFIRLIDRVKEYTKRLTLIAKENDQCRRLMSIPGIKEITATALISAVGNFNSFRNGRDLSAWLGLVPKQSSSGQKKLLLGISKRGDAYLRKLLVHGARAVVSQVKDKFDSTSIWIKKCLERIGFNKTVVALANKNARTAWAIITKGLTYDIKHANSY